MSGGAFNYNQYEIREIYQQIEVELKKQGKEKSKEDLWTHREYYEKYPEEKICYIHSEDVQQIFKDAITALKKAEVYAQRIDWYLSGDDGEENFVSRLKSDLDSIS
jgi:hypothetical protein